MGIKDYDETKTAGKEQALAFETKYKTLVTNQAKKKVSDLLKNTAKDAKAKAKTCKTAAADDQTEKDKCKAAEATLLDKTSRKKGVKDALKNSLGKDVTDVEVEQFIFEGAAVQVEEAMDGCMGDIDTSFAAGSQDRKDAMKECDDEAMETFKEARMYDGFEEAALDTEIAGVDSDINTYTTDITALENTIAGMPTGTDEEKAAKATKVAMKDTKVTAKASKEKEKVTKQEKKKTKERAIALEYTKTKKNSAKAKAWADAKAKIEIAKTAGTDMTTKVFKEAQRTAAKDAFKSGLGVDAIGDEELEEMLKETSKTEMSKNLDACYDIAMTKDDSAKKGYLSNCRKEAMKTAKDARMPKKGSIEEVLETGIAGDIAALAALNTEIEGMDAGTAKDAKVAAKATKEAEKLTKETERDVSFKKMMNEVAQEKASVTMAAALRAKPDMTEREKLDAVGIAMKESLGKPDKCDSAGVCVSQVTETDAELFLGEAAIDEVDSVMSSCVESGDKLADGYNADTAMTECETKAKDAFKAFRGGEEAALDTEINGVESDINTYTTDITALENTISGMPTSTDEEKAAKATKVALKDTKVTAKASKEKEKVTKQEKKKLKTREIEYTYTKSKQDAGRKNALAGVKAKMEIAKTAGTDMNSAAFKEETRAMAKKSIQSQYG